MGKISVTEARRRKNGKGPFVHICWSWFGGERRTICTVPVRMTTAAREGYKICPECVYMMQYHESKPKKTIEGEQKYLANRKAFLDLVAEAKRKHWLWVVDPRNWREGAWKLTGQ